MDERSTHGLGIQRCRIARHGVCYHARDGLSGGALHGASLLDTVVLGAHSLSDALHYFHRFAQEVGMIAIRATPNNRMQAAVARRPRSGQRTVRTRAPRLMRSVRPT